jgi:PAS domain S-box-containing protein
MNYLEKELYALVQEDTHIFNFLQTASLDGLWYWDLEQPENEWMNARFWETLGYDPNQMPHKAAAWQEIIFPDDLAVAQHNFQKHLEDPTHPYDQVVRYTHKSGHTVWIRCRGIIIRDETGKGKRMLGAHNDITQQKMAEEELRQQNNRLNTVIESAEIGIWEWEINSGKIHYSAHCAAMLGYTPHDFDERCAASFNNALVHPNDQATVQKAIDELLAGKSSRFKLSYRLQHQNDAWVWVTDQGKINQQDSQHKPLSVSGVRLDISTEKEKNLELNRLKDLLEKSNEAARIGTWEVDLKTNTPYWSSVTKAIHEVSEDFQPNLETAIHFFKEGDSRERIQQAVQVAIEKGVPYELDLIIITQTNKERWVKAIGIPEFENGKCKRLYGTFQDIHAMKSTELELKKSLKTNRIFVEQAPNAIAMFDTEMRYIAASQQWRADYGLENQEIIGRSHYEIFPEIGDEWKKIHSDCLEGAVNQSDEAYFERLDGSGQWLTWDVRPWYKLEGIVGGLLMLTADITPRKIAEIRLRESEEKLKAILNSSSQVSIIGTDTRGMIVYFNKGAENLLGYNASEMVGVQTPGIIHEESEMVQRGKELSKEFNKTIEGFDVFVEYAKKGLHESREWTYVRKDGSTFPVQLVVTEMRNEAQEITGFLGIATDISKIKEVEKEMASLLEISNEQNKRLLNFAHIVSHNLRSHSGNLSMLLNFLNSDDSEETRKELYPLLQSSSDSLEETVRHLNEVVGMHTGIEENLRPLNLSHFVQNAVSNVHALLMDVDGKITVNIPQSVSVMGVPAYLESAVLNFLTNAIKYRANSRPPLIELSLEREEKKVILSIADNGMGIDLEKHGEKLFGMYKTFHGNKDARGIGLFITKNQIEAMGGKIEVESTLNKGTTFKIFLHESV